MDDSQDIEAVVGAELARIAEEDRRPVRGPWRVLKRTLEKLDPEITLVLDLPELPLFPLTLWLRPDGSCGHG